ncbi:DDB1- and CUL4-associated factor 11-like [Phaenicophaeus curvirostris]|uniref:DDB1- and CUL4-associated factor 11-like n=1 Tax=Phaenicophaeus curvirostris TaxID=33595 RepID=UPI0037F09C84
MTPSSKENEPVLSRASCQASLLPTSTRRSPSSFSVVSVSDIAPKETKGWGLGECVRGVQAGSRAEQLETRIETGIEPGIERSATRCRHRLLRGCIGSSTRHHLERDADRRQRAPRSLDWAQELRHGLGSFLLEHRGGLSSVQTQTKGREERKLPHGQIAAQPREAGCSVKHVNGVAGRSRWIPRSWKPRGEGPIQAPPPSCWSCGGAGPHPDHVTRRLQQREWGRSFSAVEQNRLSSRFLPNAEVFAAAYPHKAFCGVFNGDSSLFVSACQDHSLRVYGAAGRGLRLLRSTQGRDVGWSILDVAFTPDGRHGLYCSWSPYVHAFNIHGEDETHMAMDLRPPDRRFALFSLAVGPGGQEVWGGANNGCVEVHEADVNAVALADAGGQLVLSRGDDGLVRLWDRRSLGHRGHRPVCRLAGHPAAALLPGDPSLQTFRGHVVLRTLLRCRLAPAGGRALGAGCASGGVIVYDVLTGRVLRRLSRHRGCVRDVCWGPQPWRLASASWDGTVRLWGYRSPQAEEDEEEEEEEGVPQ